MSEPLDILYCPQLIKTIFLKKENEKFYRKFIEFEKTVFFEGSWIEIEELLDSLHKAGAEKIEIHSESSFTANLNGLTLIKFLKISTRSIYFYFIHQSLLQFMQEISPETNYQLFYSQTWSEPLLSDDE